VTHRRKSMLSMKRIYTLFKITTEHESMNIND